MNPGGQSFGGIALVCDTQARVVETLADPLGLGKCFPPGRLFSSCLATGSLAKSLSFIQDIRDNGAAFDCQLQVTPESGLVRSICFNGCAADGRLLVLGAASSEAKLAGWREHDFYNELSRLNNELATAQRELTKQNCELQRLNELKTQFLGMAAHDLRNPIGHIRSFSGFLQEDAASVLTKEQLEFLSIIQSSSDFMLQLINDFLDISSIESGRLRSTGTRLMQASFWNRTSHLPGWWQGAKKSR